MTKARVMFLQSQVAFGSDSLMHSLLMRNLDRSEFEVEVACNPGRYGNSDSLQALSQFHVQRAFVGADLIGEPV